MTDDHRADVERARKVARELGSPGQDVTPDAPEADDRDLLQEEIRRRQDEGTDPAPS